MESSSPDVPRNPPRLSPDDALPAVEPPDAGFIVQLFVVPGVIVTIIVLVWLAFNWLARMGNDPMAYVEAIQRNNAARWQAAVNLANALNNDKGAGYEELRNNHQIVQELAATLDKELDGTAMDDNSVTFRMFLCRAIGAFQVPDGLPVLLKAARTNRDTKETMVRRWALDSVALLADNVRKAAEPEELSDPELEPTLLAAAGDSDPLVRLSAAYAMGVVGGEPLINRLRALADDAHPDVRYNAATGLARHGNPAAIPVLLEMIDPEEDAGVKIEAEASREFKQALIQYNGLQGIKALPQANPHIDVRPFIEPLEKLLKTNPPTNIRLQAEGLLEEMKNRPAQEGAAEAEVKVPAKAEAEPPTERNGAKEQEPSAETLQTLFGDDAGPEEE